MKAINPATGETLKEYADMSDAEAKAAVESAHETFLSWKHTTFEERAVLMRRAASVMREHKDAYAMLMTEEMGKVFKDAQAEVEKCALTCDFYAENAGKFLADEQIQTEAADSFVTYQPIGVVLAVMPWNFPFWQVFRFAVPALMAGNTGVLKHASNVPGSALAIEEIFREAGFPEHAFRTLLIRAGQVDGVIAHPHVRAVTLTGSTKAGQSVASKAGQCLKKTVLELGGSDAYIVLEDADLEHAASTCVKSRLVNAGQSCIAAKRFIVVESVYERFLALFTEKMRATVMGDPTDPKSDIGPQASQSLRDELHQQVRDSVAKGATCLLGGEIPDGPGSFYPPTVLVDLEPGMPAYDEELFGPVASIIKVKDEEEAVEVANGSVFGLGGAVFTQDIARGRKIAREKIDSGACFVNELVRSDPRLPFGGVKESGYGRELSYFGIREFVNIKSVLIR